MDTKHPYQQGETAQAGAQQAPPNDPGSTASPWQHHYGMPHPAWGMPYYGYPSHYAQQLPGMATQMPPPMQPHAHPQMFGQMPPQMPGLDPSATQSSNTGAAGGNGFAAALGDIADSSGLGMFKNLFNLDDSDFWKGALVGAAAMLLISNEGLRDSLIGGVAKTAEAMKSGLSGLGDTDAGESGEPTTDEEEQPV